MYSHQLFFPKLICIIMMKYIFSLFLSLKICFCFAQMTTIAMQSFEEENDSWTISSFSSPPCTVVDDTWNYHTSLGEISPSDGSRFWGIKDLNGNCGSSNFETIEFQNLDVSGYRNVLLTFEIYVVGYDNGDDMHHFVYLVTHFRPLIF